MSSLGLTLKENKKVIDVLTGVHEGQYYILEYAMKLKGNEAKALKARFGVKVKTFELLHEIKKGRQEVEGLGYPLHFDNPPQMTLTGFQNFWMSKRGTLKYR